MIAKRRYALSELPVTLWVEAKTHSEALRDIRVLAKVNGEVFDRVAATAIWLDAAAGITERKSTPLPSDLNIDEPALQTIINNQYISMTDGTRYGYGPYRFDPVSSVDLYFGGRILVGFRIYPEAIIPKLNEYGIFLDGGRRVRTTYETLKYLPLSSNGPVYQVSQLSYSLLEQVEYVNDDEKSPKVDEDNIPKNSETLTYAFDAPGEPISPTADDKSNAYKNRLSEFEEFARISLGTDLSGNGISGSRCSEIREWELEYHFVIKGYSRSAPYEFEEQIFRDTTWYNEEMTPSPRLLLGNGNGTISYDFSDTPPGVFLLNYYEDEKSWSLNYTSYDSGLFKYDLEPCLSTGDDSWTCSGSVVFEIQYPFYTVEVNLGSYIITILNNGSKNFSDGSIISIPNLKIDDTTGYIEVTK
jgi:hypothetical protein